MNKAANTVCSAIIEMDTKTVIVNNKAYYIAPPTIHKIAGAVYYLSDMEEGQTIREILMSFKDVGLAAHALSWFIKGDDSLFEELCEGTLDEVVDALEVAYSLISAENFIKLSALAKDVASLAAKQQ